MIGRNAVRAGTVVAAAALPMLIASRAMARPPGGGRDAGLTLGETLLIFVATPLAAFVIISLLVVMPGAARGPRYRPGLGWRAGPAWFGGPQGHSDVLAEGAEGAEPSRDGGGASARW
ncbi:MAG: aa3-type cytochrome oxidase subunit CtaJ [Carbonactinosporaceae bacterium]